MFDSKYSLLGALLLVTGSVGAQAQSESSARAPEILRVLVKTDADRHIVDIDPALRLTTKAQSVLRSNLEHYLENAGSKAPDYLPNNQFVADMATVITETDGQKALHFELVSTHPAPPREWPQRTNLSGNGPIGPLVDLPTPIPPTRSN